MLRKALNIHWSSHIPNQQLYGDLPAVSNKIASRRLQLAGHCYRHPELSTQKLVLWEPTHGHRGRGRPNTTYIDTLKRDTGAFEASEIAVLMADKRLWKDLVSVSECGGDTPELVQLNFVTLCIRVNSPNPP